MVHPPRAREGGKSKVGLLEREENKEIGKSKGNRSKREEKRGLWNFVLAVDIVSKF